MKEQKNNKGNVLVAESAYNARNAQLASYCLLPTGTKKVPQSNFMPQNFSEHT